MTDSETELACSGRRKGCLGKGEPLHQCPFACEINEDYDDVCNCCENCEQECRDDI